MPRHIVIDTDPGIDDAVAILLALGMPEALSVGAVIAVAGNLSVELAEHNARAILTLAERSEIPVYAGCARPLLRPLSSTAHIHGDDGIGGWRMPEPAVPRRAQHGVDALIELLRAAEPKSIDLCLLAPLTNLAMALAKAPDIAERIGEVVLMGGACFDTGNITPLAEFNIHADPHAAAMVLASGLDVTVVSLDVTHKVLTTRPRLARLRRLGSRCGIAVAQMLGAFEAARTGRFGRRGQALHDPCVVAYLLRPDLFRGREVNVMVETESPLTLGATVVDWWGVTGRPANARWLDRVDAGGVYDLLFEALARLP
jgi:purine nucleosidase